MIKISDKQNFNSITIGYFNKLEIYCLKISLRKLENNKGQLNPEIGKFFDSAL